MPPLNDHDHTLCLLVETTTHLSQCLHTPKACRRRTPLYLPGLDRQPSADGPAYAIAAVRLSRRRQTLRWPTIDCCCCCTSQKCLAPSALPDALVQIYPARGPAASVFVVAPLSPLLLLRLPLPGRQSQLRSTGERLVTSSAKGAA